MIWILVAYLILAAAASAFIWWKSPETPLKATKVVLAVLLGLAVPLMIVFTLMVFAILAIIGAICFFGLGLLALVLECIQIFERPSHENRSQ